MLLIDGVKYELWTPPTEDEFERVVKEHSQDIFGEPSIHLDIKTRLKSELGTGSVPDGLLIFFGDRPHWRIIEIELSGHPLHDHIVAQVGRFISGIENISTQKKIVDILYSEIVRNDLDALKLRKTIQPIETYKFLSDLISTLPILTIIIEKETPELREALRILRYHQIKVVEFQTFVREGVGLSIHAHLFEPLFKPIPPKEREAVSPELDEKSFEISLPSSCMQSYYIHIPQAKKDLFPSFKTMLELDTDVGTIETGFNIDPQWGAWLSKGLGRWFKAYPELKVGSKVRITAIEPMKRYRLALLK